ncbi:hypothetical protein BHYA_0170g00100 [Botrytis hyacinthi]|uniref:Uncharacterized protein n=1 Tax=Botrytis hyacinthi TaxID=278943 RepID=A0A4Z1GG32_9HELO|nr:hypothetical protein BHYA_0170g00100 [Botrytis hyacinthi]
MESKRRVWLYSTPKYPCFFSAEGDRFAFAFLQGSGLVEVSERHKYNSRRAYLGKFYEGDTTSFYGTAAIYMTKRFLTILKNNTGFRFHNDHYFDDVQDAFDASSSSSGQSSTSNSTRDTPEQKPKDEKKAGKSITAASRTEERTQPSISSDERPKNKEKEEADNRKNWEAYEREKQKRADEKKKRREQADAAEMGIKNALIEEFNADRSRDMAPAKKAAMEYLRDDSPMRHRRRR